MISMTTTFKDILKEGFLDKQNNVDLNLTHALTILGVTLAIGIFIFFVYRFTYEGVIYNHSYNVSILLISLITSLIIMTISSNLVLSLGMVGALSIVRFRTAIKEPMDIVFMFWAIAVGITSGAGLFYLAAAGSAFIGCTIVIMSFIKTTKSSYILMIYYEKTAETDIKNALKDVNYLVKSKTLTDENIELTLKVKVKKNDTSFVEKINTVENVKSVSLVNFEENYL